MNKINDDMRNIDAETANAETANEEIANEEIANEEIGGVAHTNSETVHSETGHSETMSEAVREAGGGVADEAIDMDALNINMPEPPHPNVEADATPDIAFEDIIEPRAEEEGPEIGPELGAKLGQEAEAEETIASLKDQLLRVRAEGENLRRRADRDVSQAKKYGALGLARDLLASVDNLEKAIALIPEQKDGLDETLKNILIGVEMSGRELTSLLARHHIHKIEAMGVKFDYNLHQAMFEVETNEAEPGQVVQIIQTGYILHDRLLRPALVGVAKATQHTQNEAPQEGNVQEEGISDEGGQEEGAGEEEGADQNAENGQE